MDNIVEATDNFVFQLFKDKLPNTFVYHNYTHTKRVYKSINEIIENSQIDVKDATILRLAALLHSGQSGEYRGMPPGSVAVLAFNNDDAPLEPGNARLAAFWWP